MVEVSQFVEIDYWQSVVGKILPNAGETYFQLLVFTLGIVAYGILIYHLYKFVAKRDVFGFDTHKYIRSRISGTSRITDIFVAIVNYGIAFPFIVFLWFAGFSVLLFFMAKSIDITTLLWISITIVSAIRITAYYTEDLSKDIAKTLPFALLAIAIVDPEFFSISLAQERIASMAAFLPQIIQFSIFTVLLEWILRILLSAKHAIFGIRVGEDTVIK